MSNKLFIICPFSCMESFLQKKYGNDIFFLTFSGAVFQYQELEYLSALKQFIIQEDIKTIYIVNDTSCRLINGIINKNKLFGLKSEKVIEDLYIEHYFSDFKDQTLMKQQSKLAELNIKKQANEMINSMIIGNCISKFDIEINGLITSKDKKIFKKIRIENSNNKVYEL